MELLPWKAAIVASALVNVPGTDMYILLDRLDRQPFFMWVLDIKNGTAFPLPVRLDYFCAGVVITADGRPAFVGGMPASRTRGSAINAIGVYDTEKRTIIRVANMTYDRWYPTPITLADGKVLIVSGSDVYDAGVSPPKAEVWDPARPGAAPALVPLPATFQAMENRWYPFIKLLPNGDIFWLADAGGSITDSAFALRQDLPPLPADLPYRVLYPHTATVSMMALSPRDNYTASIVIFGGGHRLANWTSAANATLGASPWALRLDLVPCGTPPGAGPGYCPTAAGWQRESMLGTPRVMGDSVLLPSGKVLLHGGARAGTAGLFHWRYGNRATGALTAPLAYDPSAPPGSRFTPLAASGVARLYHSTACLTASGRVLVAGSETSANFTNPPEGLRPPEDGTMFEKRLEYIIPADIGPGVERPKILAAPAVIQRGMDFEVAFSYADGRVVSGASLAAPCAATHSINMHQNVVMLEVVSDGSGGSGVARLSAPPASLAGLAPPGRYMLFLLGERGSYSTGAWVTVA